MRNSVQTWSLDIFVLLILFLFKVLTISFFPFNALWDTNYTPGHLLPNYFCAHNIHGQCGVNIQSLGQSWQEEDRPAWRQRMSYRAPRSLACSLTSPYPAWTLTSVPLRRWAAYIIRHSVFHFECTVEVWWHCFVSVLCLHWVEEL